MWRWQQLASSLLSPDCLPQGEGRCLLLAGTCILQNGRGEHEAAACLLPAPLQLLVASWTACRDTRGELQIVVLAPACLLTWRGCPVCCRIGCLPLAARSLRYDRDKHEVPAEWVSSVPQESPG